MHIDILSLFPKMLEGFFTNSIMARAVEAVRKLSRKPPL